jgi:peroxiredoxin
MAQLEPHKSEIGRLGASLVYIAAEKRCGLWRPQQYLAQHAISFPFLLDEDRAITKAYGLYHSLGHDAFRIARPATLLVDHAGTCRYIYRGDNQLDRAPIDDVLQAAAKLCP